jgi:hypothetical protein
MLQQNKTSTTNRAPCACSDKIGAKHRSIAVAIVLLSAFLRLRGLVFAARTSVAAPRAGVVFGGKTMKASFKPSGGQAGHHFDHQLTKSSCRGFESGTQAANGIPSGPTDADLFAKASRADRRPLKAVSGKPIHLKTIFIKERVQPKFRSGDLREALAPMHLQCFQFVLISSDTGLNTLQLGHDAS